MNEEMKMIEITKDNIFESPCCGIKNTEHEGFKQKTDWLIVRSAGQDSEIL